MNPLWLLTFGIAVLGGALLVALLRGAAEAARLLTDELTRQREIADAIARLGDEVRRTPWPTRGRRYPSS